jgi:hypothetical protein
MIRAQPARRIGQESKNPSDALDARPVVTAV